MTTRRRNVKTDSTEPLCALFIDDELAVVDELIDAGVPAMHIDELVGLSDVELKEVLRYSVKGAKRRRREYAAEVRAAADAAGS